MTPDPAPPAWIRLTLLGERFRANLRGLAARRPGLADALRGLVPTQTYHLLASADRVQLGVATPGGDGTAGGVRPVAHPLTPAAAMQLVGRLCPGGHCAAPLLVVGEDLGWLWNALYAAPCRTPATPGHRPPLYFLIRDLERLWVLLHVQDWAALLADPRVQLFVGPDAFDQFRASLAEHATTPWPRAAATVDASLWPAGVTIDDVIRDASAALADRAGRLRRQLAADPADRSAAALAGLFQSDAAAARPLKVLGITSRFTTFLQHSMRDWLTAFERLGHRTRIVIEGADHEMTGSVAFAQACAEFRPDLVVCIDHFRRELGGLPDNVPVAMWVQDALPTLFCPAAGAAQGPRDYCLGFGRLRMVREFGYPPARYMPAIVGLDEARFAPRDLSAADRERFGGEVAYVGHASEPGDAIVRAEVDRLGSPTAGRLLWTVFEGLKAVYDAGGTVTEPIAVERLVGQAMADARTAAPPEQVRQVVEFFHLRVNNALFRHQSLAWLADMGVDLRLWGRGWEAHPTLGKFARGMADNGTQLPLIYQAASISLQVTPHGAVHQRLMEGLAAGGFFLVRHCPGDELEREFRTIWDWCRTTGVTTDEALTCLAPPAVRAGLARVNDIFQYDVLAAGRAGGGGESFVDTLRASADDGYIRSAGTVWGDDYDAVAFRSAAELRARVAHYLANPDDRRRVAASMRRAVLDRFTYTATTRRLLAFMADDLAKQAAAATSERAVGVAA